ncbi:hypothetical protein FA13DRAFT_1739917 [Coprinellus micaceus]|uniref:Protein kinase domain-containing protein n=1 Tax=Coprinellus micaceus TaxID=71717 RepID=A0A4Y7SPC7_COPMI|nr:hypothetical protein FA13DRAFT_1739917 [Coprinellus micaceus]
MSYGQGYHPQFAQGSSGYAPQQFQPQPGYHQQFTPQQSPYNSQIFPNPATYNPQFTPAVPAYHQAFSAPEQFWRDRYGWLLSQGYKLPVRYSPQFQPSPYDNTVILNPYVIDAVRSDRVQVVLKCADRREGSDDLDEVGILGYFASEDVSDDPHNHTCPLLDVLRDPIDNSRAIIVMPAFRPYNSPKFDSVGEALDFIRQMLEGFAFLHEHRVAHRNVIPRNIMMDASGMYDAPFHVWKPKRKADLSGHIRPARTRTESPPKYYIIDFGHSKQYDEADMPPSHPPTHAYADRTIPEIRGSQPCDPFRIEIYTVGNLIMTDFIQGTPLDPRQPAQRGFDFLLPLATAMTAAEPADRPSMQEALDTFNAIVSQQSSWSLRSQVKRSKKRDIGHRVGEGSAHWGRRLVYITRRLPPVPGTRR